MEKNRFKKVDGYKRESSDDHVTLRVRFRFTVAR
ncbi:hypothetical protein SAMN05216308_10393 [Nitrosospira sp. Nsp13]|nr:hypothetical protein SAMN05216308_10393 [Nitrosospira sp. Nsp13]